MKKLYLLAPALITVMLLGAGCAAPGTSPAPAGTPPAANAPVAGENAVNISNFSFAPGSLTVKKGTTVVWTNNDGAAHTVTADQGTGPASNTIAPGGTYQYTFDTAGTFAYHCNIHRSMRGTVTVIE